MLYLGRIKSINRTLGLFHKKLRNQHVTREGRETPAGACTCAIARHRVTLQPTGAISFTFLGTRYSDFMVPNGTVVHKLKTPVRLGQDKLGRRRKGWAMSIITAFRPERAREIQIRVRCTLLEDPILLH